MFAYTETTGKNFRCLTPVIYFLTIYFLNKINSSWFLSLWGHHQPKTIQSYLLVFNTNLFPGCSLCLFLCLLFLFVALLLALLQPWGGWLLILCCRFHPVLLLFHLNFRLVFTFECNRGRRCRAWCWGTRPRLNFGDDLPLLGCMLLQHSAQFIDVDKGFGTVCLGTSQTVSQGVPELHGWQILRGGLGVLRLEEGQDLGTVLGESWAVLHKLWRWKKENRKEEKARWPRKGTERGRKKKIIATTYCYQVFPVYSQCTVNVVIITTAKQLEQILKHMCKLTSANNLWFSAWRTCAFFFAEAKGDWVMWVGTGCWALSGDTYFARCWEDDLEAEQEGWGLSSSSSSSRTMILSAIEAGATAIQNVGNSAFGKHKK